MPEPPNIFMRLSNGAENIALVRQALSGVADQLELGAGVINDIRTAATEACNNVAVHAYSGGTGPLEVEIGCRARALEVVVRDHGTGIRPRIRGQSESALGIGLAIIQALARRVEFNDPPGGGTEVRMEFTARPRKGLDTGKVLRSAPREPPADGLSSTAVFAIAPSRLAQSVLPRVLTVLAAHAHFTTDRISDLVMIADALAAEAQGAGGNDELRVTARVASRRIELEVGPLPGGVARALVSAARGEDPANPIGRLTDEQRIDGAPNAREATLVLALAERA